MRVASVARWLTFALLAAAPAARPGAGPRRGRGVRAAPGRPQGAAVFRRLSVGALAPARAPPRQRGLRPDDRRGERPHLAAGDRRRGVLAVQPRPADRRPDEYRLSRRPPLHL